MFKTILWVLTGFGFLGMWNPNIKPNPEKKGLFVCYLTFPFGTSSTKVVKTLSRLRPYTANEAFGKSILELKSLQYNHQPSFSRDDDPILVFKKMREEEETTVAVYTDSVLVKKIEQICMKSDIGITMFDVTSDTKEMIRRDDENRAKNAVLRALSQEEFSCPNCDYESTMSHRMSCRNCGYPIGTELFDIDKMMEIAMKADPSKPLKLIKRAA